MGYICGCGICKKNQTEHPYANNFLLFLKVFIEFLQYRFCFMFCFFGPKTLPLLTNLCSAQEAGSKFSESLCYTNIQAKVV